MNVILNCLNKLCSISVGIKLNIYEYYFGSVMFALVWKAMTFRLVFSLGFVPSPEVLRISEWFITVCRWCIIYSIKYG